MKKTIVASMWLISSISTAGGYAPVSIPTNIDVVRGEGFVVTGAFGNVAGCHASSNNRFFVPISHPQYNILYSTVLSAFASGVKIRPYLSKCTTIGWWGYDFGTLNNSDVLSLSK